MDNRIISSTEELIDLKFWQNALKLNTSIPAIIDDFNAEQQTVSAIPAIMAKYVSLDGIVSYLPYPKIIDIPLAIQQGNGISITYPIKKGDVCTLIFSQRSIDNFIESGEISEPFDGINKVTSVLRCLDMSDAMCFPGIIANKKIQNYSTSAVEIRNEDSSVKISLSENDLNFSQGGANIKMSGGNIEINGLTVKINGIDWMTHTHLGVTVGKDKTGGIG